MDIENQIKENFYKAFYDIIDETINSSNVEYNWIIDLYKEIKNRILKFAKKNSKTYLQIDEEFDIILFEQMIKNEAFDFTSMFKLINNTYKWITTFQAPARDKETDDSKNRVVNVLYNDTKKVVSTFIRESNQCIDNIEIDYEKFLETLKNK
jgi:hypothetical protein